MNIADRPAKSAAWIIGALTFTELTAVLETLLVYAAMKEFLRVFEDPHGVGLLVVVYLVMVTTSTVIGGRLGDIFGRRKVLLILLGFALVGSIISALATSLPWIIFGRAVQGISGAILPLTYGLAYEQLRSDKAPLAVGIISGTAVVSAGLALVLGGLIVDHLNWRFIFVLSGAFALLSMAALLIFLAPSPAQPRKKLDYPGGALFILMMLSLLIGANSSRYIGQTPATILIVTGVCIGIYWVWFEQRRNDPLIDVRLLGNPHIAGANFVKFASSAGAAQMSLIFSMFLQQPTATGVGLGLAATVAGLVILPSNLIGIVCGPLTGWVAARFGGKLAATIGMSLLSISSLGLYFHHSTLLGVALLLIVKGAGITVTYAAVPLVALPHAPEGRISEVASVTTLFRGAGQIIGASVFTFVIATWTFEGGVYPSEFAYELVFLFAFVMSFLGLLVTFLIPDHRPDISAMKAKHA